MRTRRREERYGGQGAECGMEMPRKTVRGGTTAGLCTDENDPK